MCVYKSNQRRHSSGSVASKTAPAKTAWAFSISKNIFMTLVFLGDIPEVGQDVIKVYFI